MKDIPNKKAPLDLLTKMTCERLVKLFREEDVAKEDVARYRAQIVESGAFLRSVADHLALVRPDDFFTDAAVEASILSVDDAFERVTAEEPQEAQRVIPWRAWRTSGIHVN